MLSRNKLVQGNFSRDKNKWVYRGPQPVSQDTDNGRYYKIDGHGFYPSITTVLSESVDLSGWIEHVGVEAAELARDQGAERGTQMHTLLERYLNNETINLNHEMPIIKQGFMNAQNLLDDYINTIIFQEVPLWSNKLKVAGRCDLIANWLNTTSIIDFKTASKPKKKNEILNYFCQATAYSVMAHERLGIHTDQIVIIIFVDGEKEPQVFLESPESYIGELEKKISNFKGTYHG